jgi:hypothetical protein
LIPEMKKCETGIFLLALIILVIMIFANLETYIVPKVGVLVL